MNLTGQKAVITKVHTGEGYVSNETKYIYPAYERMITLKQPNPWSL